MNSSTRIVRRDWLDNDAEYTDNIQLDIEAPDEKPENAVESVFHGLLVMSEDSRSRVVIDFSMTPEWDFEKKKVVVGYDSELMDQYRIRQNKLKRIREYLDTMEEQMDEYVQRMIKT